LAHLSLGIVGHLSAQPLNDERARTGRRARAHSQRHAGWTRFGPRMDELYLVLFLNRQRAGLPHSLGRRPPPDLGLLGFALAKLQRDFPAD
jgi:hypothetical protein